MESFCGETQESSDDLSGRKKTRLKSLRSCLFGKSKRAAEEEKVKLSQSESDIAAGKGLGSDEDLACSQGMMGSRALSHDSIFLAEQVLTDVEPSRILSQENVHSKIKALQLQLQQQKWHLGPPPLLLPMKRSEDPESDCQDDGLAHSPPTNSGIGITTSPTFAKTNFQPLPLPFSLIPKLPLIKSVSQPPSHPPCLSMIAKSTTSEPPLDFSSPAEFTPSLDTSAARHRVSIKPRNQRASTKNRAHTDDSVSHLPTRNNTEHPQHPESVPEEDVVTLEKVTEQKEGDQPVTSQIPSAQLPDAPESPRKSSWSPTLEDQALLERFTSVPRPVLRVKPHRPEDNADSRRPHSSFIPSELKSKREGTFEAPAMMGDKRNTLKKAEAAESCSEHPSEVAPSTLGIKRPSPGSGSFHFSITTARNRDVERPRSGSFAGVLEQARCRTEGRSCLSLKERPEFKGLQQRGSPFPGGAQLKSSALPCDKRDSQKIMEPASSIQSVTAETAAAEVEEEECSQNMAKESLEVQEPETDGVKTAFGIKLRSASQSMRLRSSNFTAKPAAPTDAQRDDPKRHTTDVRESASHLSWKSTTSKDNQVSDPAPSGSPFKTNLPLPCDPHITPADLHMTSSHLKEAESSPPEPQPTPQTAPHEVSWVSLAMEKTRSIQQLFAGRFPRDLTGGQARPHSHVPAMNRAEALAGEQLETSLTLKAAANKPSMEEGKAETQQTRGPAQTVKPKTSSPLQSCTSAEQQTDKYHSQLRSAQTTSQPTSAWAHPHTTQSPPSSAQTETSLQSAQARVAQSLAQVYLFSAQQQQQQQQPSSPMWSDRGQVANKCTSGPSSVSVSSPVTDSLLVSASVRGEREECVQEKENTSVSGRRAIWSGSVSMKASFLEKQAHWTTLSGTKGTEVKKASAEGQMSEESMASTRITLNKDSEGGQGLKPAESSPIKVPERSCEDKCLRKNVLSSPSNAPSPAVPLAFQSSSDSSQPSWMELAKRKSMAWSDKSMD